MPCPLLIVSQSNSLIQIVDINSHSEWQTVQVQISWLLKKPTDLDLHCLQRQVISGSRTRVKLRSFFLSLSHFSKASNENPQNTFWPKNKKNIFCWKKHLIWLFDFTKNMYMYSELTASKIQLYFQYFKRSSLILRTLLELHKTTNYHIFLIFPRK